MLDPVSEKRLSQVYPPLADRARNVALMTFQKTGRRVKIAQGLRSIEDQKRIYQQGRVLVDGKWMPEHPSDRKPDGTPYSHDGIVSWAEPWESWHVFGLAVDFAFDGDDPYLERIDPPEALQCWVALCDSVESCALVSGARFPKGEQDKPHAQLTRSLSLHAARDLYQNGGLASVWAYLDRLALAGPPVST